MPYNGLPDGTPTAGGLAFVSVTLPTLALFRLDAVLEPTKRPLSMKAILSDDKNIATQPPTSVPGLSR